MSVSAAPKVAVPVPAPSTRAGRLLQRKCACESHTSSATGQCPECLRKKRLQRKLAIGASNDPLEQEADATTAPASVERTLASPGAPLEPVLRRSMEQRFGRDFSYVRVHSGGAAAQSTRDVNAHAYTVGHHIVFAPGRFAPRTHSGRQLIAHELAHVVQQRDVVQRKSISLPLHVQIGSTEDREEKEAEEVARAVVEEDAEQARGGVALSTLSTSGLVLRRQVVDETLEGGWPEKDVAACIRAAGPDPAECDPAHSLTWADFAATPPASSGFSAETWSELRERAMNVATLTCTPGAPGTEGLPARGLQAWFDPSRSWVKPQSAGSTNPAVNGCATHIAACERAMTSAAASGGSATASLSSAASTTCPAAATASGTVATTFGECTAVLGADCAATAAAESARLLRHEQGHFDLTCAMARKGNAMLATVNLATLLPAAQRATNAAQSRYDTQTRHGCNASAQATWETAIAGGLPAVTIDLTPPRRRGRRRR